MYTQNTRSFYFFLNNLSRDETRRDRDIGSYEFIYIFKRNEAEFYLKITSHVVHLGQTDKYYSTRTLVSYLVVNAV